MTQIIMNNKTAVVLGAVALFVVLLLGLSAWRSKAIADKYRTRVEVLEQTIKKIKEENAARDREWKQKLSEAEDRYEESERRWAEAMSDFSNWRPGDHPAPQSADETVKRFGTLGIVGKIRR